MDIFEIFEELEDQDFPGRHGRKGSLSEINIGNKIKNNPISVKRFIEMQDDSKKNFKFSYKAARFEEGWLLKSLGGFYEHQWIADVLRRVKGGKEASVYLCKAGAEVDADLVAVKVYRPRSLRNLKNVHLYREGRTDLDSEGNILHDHGQEHAMAKKTEYRKNLLHQSWIAHEYTFMQKMKSIGADVPAPYEMADNAILMSFIGDEDGCAPTLSEVSLSKKEAQIILERIIWNIENFLSNGFVHGDLSAYNIMYWEKSITLIDFPQVILAEKNRNAFQIFRRDVTRVCEYFTRQGIRCNPVKLSIDLWEKYGYSAAPEIDIRLLGEDYPSDLKINY